MKLYSYYVADIPPGELDETLNKFDKWELVTIVPMQRMAGMDLRGQPKIEIFFKCIFKMEKPCQA